MLLVRLALRGFKGGVETHCSGIWSEQQSDCQEEQPCGDTEGGALALEQVAGARRPWPHTHHHPRSIREPSWAEGLRKFSESTKGRDSTLFCDVHTGLGRGLINIGALS